MAAKITEQVKRRFTIRRGRQRSIVVICQKRIVVCGSVMRRLITNSGNNTPHRYKAHPSPLRYLPGRNLLFHVASSYHQLRHVKTACDTFWEVSFNSDNEVYKLSFVPQKGIFLH